MSKKYSNEFSNSKNSASNEENKAVNNSTSKNAASKNSTSRIQTSKNSTSKTKKKIVQIILRCFFRKLAFCRGILQFSAKLPLFFVS